MPDLQPPKNDNNSKSLIGRILNSDFAGKISKYPPFSWIARELGYRIASQQINRKPLITTAEISAHAGGLQGALDGIVKDVVKILGFTGAMVATFDYGEVLPVKAFYIDSKLASPETIRSWEQQLSEILGEPLSLTDPKIARLYLQNRKSEPKKDYKKNLGVQAAHAQRYLISNELFDLFTPIISDSTRDVMRGIQDALGIEQVVTIPFFVKSVAAEIVSGDTIPNTEKKSEYLGNLFAVKSGQITADDIRVLTTFAQYVASFILSERRRQQVEIIEKLILDIQKNLTSQEAIFQRIVQGMVEADLGYTAALVAKYDKDIGALGVKAFYIDEKVASLAQIKSWEQQASEMTGEPLSLTDESIAKVYLGLDQHQGNLGVKAAKLEKPVSSTELFDLFTPIAKEPLRNFFRGIQEALGVHQVIAVPFFLETNLDGKKSKELEGNLFAISRSYEIRPWELDILNAFGQQAAAGLRNVSLYEETQELYKKAEDRRKAAEIFGKMAFTASASVHALKNHLGVVKGNLQLLKITNPDNEDTAAPALKRINEMIILIENLHKPGELQNDTTVDVNSCIRRAAERAVGVDTPWIKLDLEPDLPVKTLPEMLTEALKVLIKNANEAMSSENVSEEARLLEIKSKRINTKIEVTIEDHGTGIDPENQDQIFDLRYTTKDNGLGFGLFWTKDYIEGLGGKIKVKSILGKGTKFTIHLPVAPDNSPKT